MVRSLSVLCVLWSAGCRCGGSAPAPASVETPHFGEWAPLVAAAARGDVPTTRVYARDLTAGDVPEGDGIEAVGSALGFLQIARADELVDGVVEAGAGCTACHAARRVPPPAPTAWSHADAPAILAAALAFGVAPALGEPVADADGAAEALARCAACHEQGAPTGRPGSP